MKGVRYSTVLCRTGMVPGIPFLEIFGTRKLCLAWPRTAIFWTRQFHGTDAKRVREAHRTTSETHIFFLCFSSSSSWSALSLLECYFVGIQVGTWQEEQEDRHAATKPTMQNGDFQQWLGTTFWEDKVIGQGATRNAGEDYWPLPGRSPMRAQPLFVMIK